MVSSRSLLTAIAVAVPTCLAQTSTDCNPMEKSCPADPALSSSSFSSSWTSSSSLGDGWSTTAGKIGFGDGGALFTINGAGDAPTIQSDFYFFFGTLEVTMRAAPGTGIVSSIVLLSDTLDEVDWEFTGGNPTQTQTNYFGKGNTTSYDRAIWYPVASPQTTEHTYTINWTADSITWAIDGTVVRTLAYAEANGGYDFPQTPMRVRLGSWAGGAPGNPEGTIEWAGGETDFSQAPFTMSVSSVKVTNYSPGSQYVYTDNSGSYGSIEVVNKGGASGSGGVFAPSQASSSEPAPSSTTEAGTAVTQSSTAVATSIRASSVTTGAALTSIPLQPSSTSSETSAHTTQSSHSSQSSSISRSSHSSQSTRPHSSSVSSTLTSTITSSVRISPSGSPSSNANSTAAATSPAASASPSQVDTNAAAAVGRNGGAVAALACFVAAALVLA